MLTLLWRRLGRPGDGCSRNRRWVHFLIALKKCTSAVVALSVLHKQSGDGGAGKTLHTLGFNSHLLADETEAQRGGMSYHQATQETSARAET